MKRRVQDMDHHRSTRLNSSAVGGRPSGVDLEWTAAARLSQTASDGTLTETVAPPPDGGITMARAAARSAATAHPSEPGVNAEEGVATSSADF